MEEVKPGNTAIDKERTAYKLRRIFLIEKLQNPIGYIFFSLFAIIISLIIYKAGIIGGVLFLIAITGIPLICSIIAFPKFGITICVIGAYLLMWFYGMISGFPLGTVMDGLQALLILAFFIGQKNKPDWSLFKQPIGIIILIWVSYNFLQVINPTAESRMAWLYTIRSVAMVMLMYFIFCYNIRTLPFLKFLIKVWLSLALFAAVYAFKQEYFGFFDFEKNILSDPRVRALYFIGGHWRKFSIFSDPVAFSYNMVTPAIFCICMLFSPLKPWKKAMLGIMAIIFILAMLTSGTRGAFVLIPAGMVLLVIMKLNIKVVLFSIATGILMAVLIFMPTASPSIERFQSAFKPTEDASFNVRAINQKKIQPYIQTHPFGGGLGATGVWGSRFSPHSFLAQFPPDSGYVRVAVETGSVGLLLICTLMVIFLVTGINSYFSIRDPELKSYCLAMVIIIFAYAIGNYPQEAIVQYPSNIYFYLFAAIITITKKLDLEKQAENISKENSADPSYKKFR